MEPSAQQLQEDFVCQTCGDKGITNAFVYCCKCLKAVIHRYCLLVMPKTLNECVIWYCGECKVKFSLSKKVDAANSVQVKATHPKKKLKKKKNISSLITGTKEVICKEYITKPEGKYNDGRKWVFPRHIPKKQRTNRKKFSTFLVPKKKEDYNVKNGLITGAQDSIKPSWNAIGLTKRYLKIKKDVVYAPKEQIDGSQPSKPSCKHENLNPDTSHMEKELDKATFQERNDGTATNVPQSVDFDKGNYYGYAHPVMDPIWRGNFTVLGTSNDLFKGFVAHLSNKACHQVIQEAKMLPSLLHLEMHPRSGLWPKSFKECQPSDDKIGLYFFSGDPINEKAYDHLVLNMMGEELAMKATTKNAELLIFTSIYLPPLFWRVQGKYYLWGVFRGKRNGHTSQDSSIDTKKMPTRVKTLDACSPRSTLSTLSNNGVSFCVMTCRI